MGTKRDEGWYNRRGSIVQKIATTEINSTHTVVRKELMARTRSLGSQKDVPELQRQEQGNVSGAVPYDAAGWSPLHHSSASGVGVQGQGMRTDAS